MANSRIMLVCKHCGKDFCIGKGYLGNYSTCNEELHKQLNIFYHEHECGCCSDDMDCSDNARNHFAILEEGESLDALTADVVPKSEVDRLNSVMKEMDEQRAYTINMLGESLEKAKAEVEEIKSDLLVWKQERFNLFQRLECYEMAREKVAREIFEEIENLVHRNNYCYSIRTDGVIKESLIIDGEMFAELKKKYTEKIRKED